MTGFWMVVPICNRCGKSMKWRVLQRPDGVWDTVWECRRRHPKVAA